MRNDCSGNVKKFYLIESDWFDANPGEEICFSNTGKWIIDTKNKNIELKINKISQAYMTPITPKSFQKLEVEKDNIKWQ